MSVLAILRQLAQVPRGDIRSRSNQIPTRAARAAGSFERQHPACRKKDGSYRRPARCLDGDVSSEGSGCAIWRNLPGVERTQKALAYWQGKARPRTANRVDGAHSVAGGG